MLTYSLGQEDAPALIITAASPMLLQADIMGLDYYSDVPPVAEMTGLGGVEEWAATAEGTIIKKVVIAMQFLRPVGAVVSGIHGYRRNDSSWGAALGWAALGFLFPIITPVVGLAQGYGKPKAEALFGRY